MNIQEFEILLAKSYVFNILEKYLTYTTRENKDGDIYIQFKLDNLDSLINKLSKSFRFKLINHMWGRVDEVYNTHIAADMLTQGYICTALDGGWVVSNGRGDNYQICDDECPCKAFTYNKSCKHITFRDWSISYSSRQRKLLLDIM